LPRSDAAGGSADFSEEDLFNVLNVSALVASRIITLGLNSKGGRETAFAIYSFGWQTLLNRVNSCHVMALIALKGADPVDSHIL